MKKQFTALAFLATTLLHADVIGGEVSLGYLNISPSGDFAYKGDSVDVEDTFGWGDESSISLKGYLEHPIPMLPNVRLAYTNFDFSGSGTVTAIRFDNKTYSGNIDSAMNLDVIDATVYYEILDNWVSLDLGLNAKYLDGDASVSNAILGESKADLSIVLPTLYAKARFDVPTTDLSFQAEGDIITYGGNTLYDITLSSRYTFLLGLGVEAGIRLMKFKLDDVDDVTADVDFNALYAAVVWDF